MREASGCGVTPAGGAERPPLLSYTPPADRVVRSGFTMIELLITVAAIGVLFTIYLATTRAPSAIPIESAANHLAASIERARDEAASREGEAVIALQPTVGYLALSGATGSLDPDAAAAAEWEPLPVDAAWGYGSALVTPFGDPVGDLPGRVYCDAEASCTVPGSAAVYPVRSLRDPDRVVAVTLTAEGAVQTWRYIAGETRWSPTAR